MSNLYKICPKCGLLKNFDLFYNSAKSKDGKFRVCKECNNKIRLRNKQKERIESKNFIASMNVSKLTLKDFKPVKQTFRKPVKKEILSIEKQDFNELVRLSNKYPLIFRINL